MIAIIDNGQNADKISAMIRGSKIFSLKDVPDADAYILSDGNMDAKAEKINTDLINSTDKPILGIGIGSIYMAKAYGGTAKELKIKLSMVNLKKPSPILLDFKRIFSVVDSQKYFIENCPECFGVLAGAPGYDYAVIQYGADPEIEADPLPIFGVHFNPELGLDGLKILRNFASFVEMWSKYHK